MAALFAITLSLISSPSNAQSSDTGRLSGILVLEVRGSGTCFHVSKTGDNAGLLNGWKCRIDDPNQQFVAEYKDDLLIRFFAGLANEAELRLEQPHGRASQRHGAHGLPRNNINDLQRHDPF